MFAQINWSRFMLLPIVLTVVVFDDTLIGESQTTTPQGSPGATRPAQIIAGKWKLVESGETIEITQDSLGRVTAKFSPTVPCWDLQRTALFDGVLRMTGSGNTATMTIEEGTFYACTRTERMWKECPGVAKLFQTKMRDVKIDSYGITGEVLRPGYWLPDGDFRKCRKDASQEDWVTFSLEPLCRPTAPWFDVGSECQDAKLALDFEHGGRLMLCDIEIYRPSLVGYSDQQFAEYRERVTAALSRQLLGGRVCCQKFREAVRTGRPCDPTIDVDCDGKPNFEDVRVETPGIGNSPTVSYPDINVYSIPPGASVAPMPVGLPSDRSLVPPSSECDCKWQLIKGELTCGAPGQEHEYVATWKCPTSGAETVSRHYAAAGTPCP